MTRQHKAKHVEPKSKLDLTLTYILALGLIAVLSIVGHLTLDRTIKNTEHTAAIINVSGAQRMLSQRIVVLATEYVTTDDKFKRMAARADLEAAAIFMERSHIVLTEGSEVRGVPATMSDEMRAMYFKDPINLDREVNAYLDHARALIDAPETALNLDNPDYRYLWKTANPKLLHLLDGAVKRYENEGEERIRFLERMQFGVLGATLLTLLGVALFVFRPLVSRVRRYADELYELANTDPLTGCNNRRNFMEIGGREFTKARRYKRPLSVLILDIDRFKRVNDTYGHGVGDEAIKAFATSCLATIRQADCLGRLGGEEFAVIVPETGLEGAEVAAEKLRQAIADIRLPVGTETVQFTTSVGVAMLHADDKSVHEILNRADVALYRAKDEGRNRVALDTSAPGIEPGAAAGTGGGD